MTETTKTVRKSTKRPTANVRVEVIAKAIYDGDDKYHKGHIYTVRRKWAESVIKSDDSTARTPRIKLL